MNTLNPLEIDECIALVDHLEHLKKQKKVLLFTHIAQETYTKFWKQKRKNKAMGVRSGFPDYVVITKNDIFFLEMKRKKGSVISPEQQEWIKQLQRLGFNARVCYGYEQAKEFLGI